MKIRDFVIIITTIINVFCLSACKDTNSIEISGKIQKSKVNEIVLERLSPIKIDTVAKAQISRNGNFKITFSDTVKRLYRLRLENVPPIYLCLNNNDEIKLEADYNEIENYRIEGSKDCEELKRLNEHLRQSTQKIEELRNKINQEYNLTKSQIEESNKIAAELYDSDKKFISEFIKANNTSPIIYFALRQYVSTTPIMRLETDYGIYRYVLSEMKTHNPHIEETRFLESVITKYDLQQEQQNRTYIKLESGTNAPDFSLNDENGVKQTLANFAGKEITVCFWASWDKKSVVTVQKCLDTNKLRQMILISLDTNREQWIQSIKFNRFESCVNLCDFKSWESSVAKIYGIRFIPTFVEISADGKIERIFN